MTPVINPDAAQSKLLHKYVAIMFGIHQVILSSILNCEKKPCVGKDSRP